MKLPSVELYWAEGSRGPVVLPNFGRYMSYYRFRQIKCLLRFEDYQNYNADEHRRDKAWKIRTITHLMQAAFRQFMPAPGQFLSVDEGMVRYTGRRCPLKRVMPNKPISRGVNFFAAVDYATGILVNFSWDDSVRTAENCAGFPWGFTGQVVLDLIDPLPGVGYIVVTDNYYTSTALARQLILRGHRLVGTMRKQRGVPAEIVLQSKRPTRACPKGTTRTARTIDGHIYVHSWMDNGPVYVLDTVCGPAVEIITRREGAQMNQYEVPKAFAVYNQNMGGVDRFDQLRTGSYGVEMHGRCAKWTIRCYEALLNMAYANAYAAWKHTSAPNAEVNHSNFVFQVAEWMLNNVFHRNDDRLRRGGAAPDRDHTLQRHEPGSDGSAGAGNRRKRGYCTMCEHPNRNKRRTTYYCGTCNVPLHPGACYELHKARHTELGL